MGWLTNIIKKINKGSSSGYSYADMLNGYAPIFSQFGQNIFASDAVQQAVECIVSETKKLRPLHVREKENDIVPVKGSVQDVLNNPNPLMTTCEFIEKIIWQLLANYNSFVIPTKTVWHDNGVECRKYTGLFPVQPTMVEFIQDAGGSLFIKMRFQNSYETTLLYDDVIHLRYRFSNNEFLGGNESGQPDNSALLKTLELNHYLLQGVSKAMKSSFTVNGVVKYKTLMDKGEVAKNLKELESKINSGESGFLGLDMSAEYIPIKKDVKLVDKDTIEFVDSKILRHFGVPLPILTGDYNTEQYAAFYQKTLEPIIVSLQQAFTKKLFTDRERSFGNKVQFYPEDLVFMNTSQTLEMIRLLGDSGALYENEKRIALGLQPLPELAGKRMQSLNYVDVNIASNYQVGGNEKEGEENGQ